MSLQFHSVLPNATMLVLLAARGLPISPIMAISEYSLLPNFCHCERVRVESHLVLLICLTTSEGISRTSLVLCASGSVRCLFMLSAQLFHFLYLLLSPMCTNSLQFGNLFITLL